MMAATPADRITPAQQTELNITAIENQLTQLQALNDAARLGILHTCLDEFIKIKSLGCKDVAQHLPRLSQLTMQVLDAGLHDLAQAHVEQEALWDEIVSNKERLHELLKYDVTLDKHTLTRERVPLLFEIFKAQDKEKTGHRVHKSFGRYGTFNRWLPRSHLDSIVHDAGKLLKDPDPDANDFGLLALRVNWLVEAEQNQEQKEYIIATFIDACLLPLLDKSASSWMSDYHPDDREVWLYSCANYQVADCLVHILRRLNGQLFTTAHIKQLVRYGRKGAYSRELLFAVVANASSDVRSVLADIGWFYNPENTHLTHRVFYVDGQESLGRLSNYYWINYSYLQKDHVLLDTREPIGETKRTLIRQLINREWDPNELLFRMVQVIERCVQGYKSNLVARKFLLSCIGEVFSRKLNGKYPCFPRVIYRHDAEWGDCPWVHEGFWWWLAQSPGFKAVSEFLQDATGLTEQEVRLRDSFLIQLEKYNQKITRVLPVRLRRSSVDIMYQRISHGLLPVSSSELQEDEEEKAEETFSAKVASKQWYSQEDIDVAFVRETLENISCFSSQQLEDIGHDILDFVSNIAAEKTIREMQAENNELIAECARLLYAVFSTDYFARDDRSEVLQGFANRKEWILVLFYRFYQNASGGVFESPVVREIMHQTVKFRARKKAPKPLRLAMQTTVHDFWERVREAGLESINLEKIYRLPVNLFATTLEHDFMGFLVRAISMSEGDLAEDFVSQVIERSCRSMPDFDLLRHDGKIAPLGRFFLRALVVMGTSGLIFSDEQICRIANHKTTLFPLMYEGAGSKALFASYQPLNRNFLLNRVLLTSASGGAQLDPSAVGQYWPNPPVWFEELTIVLTRETTKPFNNALCFLNKFAEHQAEMTDFVWYKLSYYEQQVQGLFAPVLEGIQAVSVGDRDERVRSYAEQIKNENEDIGEAIGRVERFNELYLSFGNMLESKKASAVASMDPEKSAAMARASVADVAEEDGLGTGGVSVATSPVTRAGAAAVRGSRDVELTALDPTIKS